MKQRLYYYLVWLLLCCGKVLPKRGVYAFSGWIMQQYYRRRPKRVEIMHANIRRAFPEKDEEEIASFGNAVYKEVSKTIAEWLLLYHKRLDISAVVVNREEALGKLAMIRSGSSRAMIILTAHYGNWELLGNFLGCSGFPIHTVFKSTGNSLIDEHILIPSREVCGNGLIEHKGSMSSMIHILKAGDILALLIDQVVQPPNGVPVHFFGHRTAATKSAAMLKLKYDPVVIPVFMARIGVESFEVRVGDPIEPAPEIYTDKQKQIEDMTQSYYDVIEEQIRHKPEQWLWMYNRWKRVDFGQ